MPAPLPPDAFTVPADEKHLPRAQRSHPYRALNDAEAADIRAEVERVVREMMPRLRALVGARFRREDEHAEGLQTVLLYLLERGFVTFDRTGKADICGWLYGCARFALRDFARQTRRSHRGDSPRRAGTFSDIETDILASGDEGIEGVLPSRQHITDPLIERLAESLMRDPERYLPPAQAEMLRAIVDHPGISTAELAALLGYKTRGICSAARNRLYQSIMQLDLWDPTPLASRWQAMAARGGAGTGAAQARAKRKATVTEADLAAVRQAQADDLAAKTRRMRGLGHAAAARKKAAKLSQNCHTT